MPRHARAVLGLITLGGVLLTSAWFFSSANQLLARPYDRWLLVWGAKTAIEVVASTYCVFYIVIAMAFRRPFPVARDAPTDARTESVVAAYLCCNDFDHQALASIAACTKGIGEVIVHDDSTDESERRRVDEEVASLVAAGAAIRLLRRKSRQGGKPGAVNNVLGHLSPGTAFLLLLDSDSYLLDEATLARSLSYFDDPRTAVVQFRTVGHVLPSHGSAYRVLSSSITFYDVFVDFMDRVGWAPFLGHNAMLRVDAVKAVAGFTPGQLADDIDFSVRVRLAGHRIRYARDILAGELHPASYEALRRRTYKWAYGCTQVLLRWTLRLATSPDVSNAEKAVFFLTVSYYHFQAILLLYLTIFYVVLPFGPSLGGVRPLLVSASLILLLTFLPSITWFFRHERIRDWPRHAGIWAVTYGSLDLVSVRGICSCLVGKSLAWIPTNARTGDGTPLRYASELLFGGVILGVAAFRRPELLILPTTALFAGKFIVAPFLEGLFASREA